MRRVRLLAFLGACAWMMDGALARAVDPWEAAQDFANNGDDDNESNNTLSHGISQNHDLDQAGGGDDQDWFKMNQVIHHSYETRISGTSVGFSFGTCTDCAQF